MLAILKKELWSYFGNWSAWIIIAGFSLISTLFLFFFENDFNILDIGTASLQSFFTLSPWLFIFIIPALSMKTFAEEQQSGTLQWLFAQPLRISEIILGKYFAVIVVSLLCLLPSLIYLYTIYTLGIPEGNIDTGATLGSYFGLIILISSLSSIGILSSAIASNQVIAYLLGVMINFFLYFGIEQLASFKLLGNVDYFIQNLGFYHHFMAFTRGLIDFKDISYFLLVISISLLASNYFILQKK